MSDKIKEALNKARQNKQPLKEERERVEGQVIISTQVSKRNNPTGAFSEMTIVEVEGVTYTVLHHFNGMPSMDSIWYGEEGNYKAVILPADVVDTIVEAIVDYRHHKFEKEYVNMYSYLWGYCMCDGFDLSDWDLF